MERELRILILEDSADTADLALRELRGGGIQFSSRRVETREEYLVALEEFRPGPIISDQKQHSPTDYARTASKDIFPS